MEKDSKLFGYLSACSGYELRRFRLFLESPYHNQRQDVLKAWDAIRPHLSGPESPPTPQQVFEAAYPGQPYSPAKHRHLLSELTARLEAFWQVQSFQRQPSLQDQLLLQHLSARGQDQAFERLLATATQRQEANPMRDHAFLYERYALCLQAHDHAVQQHNRGTHSGLAETIAALDEYYFAQKLRLAAAAINRDRVLGDQTVIDMLPAILATIDAQPPRPQGSLVGCYRLVLHCLQAQRDHLAFEELLQQLSAAEAQQPPATMAELYSFALNYCVRMVNLAEPGFDAQLHTLYGLLFERGYLLEQGRLPVPHFKNYVTLSLRLGRSGSLQARLQHLAGQLPPDIRPNALHYTEAAIAFYAGEYGRALRMLQQVAFTDVYYHLDAKSLMLKLWYEQGETEALLSLIEAFKLYLRRSHKIGDYQRDTYRNQIKMVQAMTRFRLGGRISMAQITDMLQGLRPIADLAWLERKVEELGA